MMVEYSNQRGVTFILTAFIVSMSLGAMGVLAAGYNVWEKNRLQGVADLVALTAARQLSDGPAFPAAMNLAHDNGVTAQDTLSIQCIQGGVPTADCNNSITSRVTLVRTVASILPFFPAKSLTVVAEATSAPTIVGTVASSLLSVDTNKSRLLNGLLTALGGGSVNLSVAQWGGLLNSNIELDLLALQAELGVATLDELLNLNVSALRLLQDSLLVGNGDAADKAAVTGVLSALSGPLNGVNLKVGDLLAADLSGRTNTPLMVNLGQLAQVTVLNASKGVGYTLPISSGLLNLDVGVQILEAPQIFVGRKFPGKDPIAVGKTAQIALDLRVRQALGLNLALINISALDLRLQLRVAGGLAQVNQLSCRFPREENVVEMTVVPSVLDLCIADSASNLNSTVGALACGPPANILSVSILGLPATSVKLGAKATLRPDVTEVQFSGVAPFTQTVHLNLGQTLSNLLGNLTLNPQVNVLGAGLLTAVVEGLVQVLLAALKPVLSPILGLVGTLLDGLLPVLGVSLNDVQVNVASMDCQSVVLTR